MKKEDKLQPIAESESKGCKIVVSRRDPNLNETLPHTYGFMSVNFLMLRSADLRYYY